MALDASEDHDLTKETYRIFLIINSLVRSTDSKASSSLIIQPSIIFRFLFQMTIIFDKPNALWIPKDVD